MLFCEKFKQKKKQMKAVVIYSHPWEKSFNRAILNTVVQSIEQYEGIADVIDLYKDNFNPVLSVKDLAVYKDGKTTDSQAENYLERIEQADHLFIIFPVWWYSLPAMLKGFMDKVLLKNRVYDTSKTIPEEKLNFLKSTTVISTMNSPAWYYRLIMCNTLKFSFINGTLKFCGVKNIKWFKISNVSGIDDAKRKLWLEKISRHIVKTKK